MHEAKKRCIPVYVNNPVYLAAHQSVDELNTS